MSIASRRRLTVNAAAMIDAKLIGSMLGIALGIAMIVLVERRVRRSSWRKTWWMAAASLSGLVVLSSVGLRP